jgi:transposase
LLGVEAILSFGDERIELAFRIPTTANILHEQNVAMLRPEFRKRQIKRDCKEIREQIEKSSRLKLVFLPAYSPQLNLIERVWRFFKKKILYNRYYKDLKAFRAATFTPEFITLRV